MADLADVETTLKTLIVAAIYPTGTGNPSKIVSGSTPVPCKVGRGWPLKTALHDDLAAGVANISVFAQPGAERNTTRFPKAAQVLTEANPTITAAVSGNTVTLGGTVSLPHNLAVLNAGSAYTYAVQVGDTLTTIAAALAALIAGASSAGPVITIPGSIDLAARVGAAGTGIAELRRQERLFQVTCWCQTPEQRDAVAGFVDKLFAGLDFITLPDQSAGRILYARTFEIDNDELSGLFRRDLIYSVEYATTDIEAAYQIVTEAIVVTAGFDLSAPAPPVTTLNL